MKFLNALAGATLIGILISGCSGGSTSSSAIPQVGGKSPSSQGIRILGHLNVSRAQARSVAAKVRHSSAWALPMRGVSMQGHRIHKMTAGAGNDLVNNGGPTMGSATSYNILVNASDESPWGGMISQYQNDMNNSNMIGILTQYTGGGLGSYPVAGDYTVSYNTSTQLADQDIYNIVYQVASQTGATGYGAIYHVFLQNGVQQCSQSAGGCYGQQYCAYHGATDYTDIGHVIYSTQPYEAIPGCDVGAGSPNGDVADSTASVLSHESYEAYTDPDVQTNLAWYNQTAGEIGDICAPANGVPTGVVQLGNDNWQIQPEYDNNVHDCSFTP